MRDTGQWLPSLKPSLPQTAGLLAPVCSVLFPARLLLFLRRSYKESRGRARGSRGASLEAAEQSERASERASGENSWKGPGQRGGELYAPLADSRTYLY